MAGRGWHRPTPLTSAHVLSGFSCGKPELDEWLVKRALANHASGATRTHVVEADGRVVGYFSLASAAIAHQDVKGPARRNMPDPIPAVLLARFAVDQKHQGEGLGLAMLAAAIETARQAAERVGIACMLVHAKDEDARHFYLRHDFELSPTDPMHLILVFKDLPPKG
ncbi:MAG: GNAT family N-acetyltransferase [Actinomycetota bacterium]|nr:GNAT family N-acetyltransferase [Actinomycetota bacterium]